MRTHALTPPVIDLSSAFVYMLVVGGGGYMALSDQFDMDGASIIAFLIGLVIVLILQEMSHNSLHNFSPH